MTNLPTRVKEALRNETAAEEAEIVAAYAEADELERRAKKLKEEARERATELYEGYGLTALNGDEGVVTISYRKGSVRIDTALVRKILTKKQIEEVSVQSKDTLVIAFKARGV